MTLPFLCPKLYTSEYSADQVKTIILELLAAKTKILFFSFKTHYGTLKDGQFKFSAYNTELVMLSPTVKGKIFGENRTVVEIKDGIPIVMLLFYSLFPAFMIPMMWLSDEITINGVLREPTILERIGFSIFSIGVPGVIFFFNTFLPLRRLRGTLKEKLKLYEKRQFGT
jgi:hypothetical protein